MNRDRKQKAPTYAKAKIPDYWVLDVNERKVYVFRDPGLKTYQQETILDENATLALIAFPDINVSLSQLFP